MTLNIRGMTTARKWFEVRAEAGSDSAEIFIYDQIGYDWWDGSGVTATKFVEELNALSVSKIDLRLNSPGGLVFDGVTIANAIARHPADVTVHIDGLAASIASVIAIAGNHVRMADNALFMIHNPATGIWGEARDLRKEADVLDQIRDSLIVSYKAKTGMSEEDLIAAMDAETWYSAAKALEAGFVDELTPSVPIKATFDLSRFRNAPKPEGTQPAAAPVPAATSDRQSSLTQEQLAEITQLIAAHATSSTNSGSGGAPDRDQGGAPGSTSKTETWVPGLGFISL